MAHSLFHNELSLELDNPIVMESLCYSAAASHKFTSRRKSARLLSTGHFFQKRVKRARDHSVQTFFGDRSVQEERAKPIPIALAHLSYTFTSMRKSGMLLSTGHSFQKRAKRFSRSFCTDIFGDRSVQEERAKRIPIALAHLSYTFTSRRKSWRLFIDRAFFFRREQNVLAIILYGHFFVIEVCRGTVRLHSRISRPEPSFFFFLVVFSSSLPGNWWLTVNDGGFELHCCCCDACPLLPDFPLFLTVTTYFWREKKLDPSNRNLTMMLFWTCKSAESTVELLGACSVCQLIVVICISRQIFLRRRWNNRHGRTQVAELSIALQHRPPVKQCWSEKPCCLRDWKFWQKSGWTVHPHVADADAKVSEPHVICQHTFFFYSSWWIAEWSRLERVYIRREPRRFGDKVIICSHTSTVDAVERLGVGPTSEFGDWRTQRMDKTRMSSVELQCKQCTVLGKATERIG